MTQRFTIPGTLPNANDYIDACRRNAKEANRLKRNSELVIAAAIRKAKIKAVGKVIVHYLWIERDRRRDKDNISFAQKFIQDALVRENIIRNDGWSCITGFTHKFDVDKKNPRIVVTLEPTIEEES